MAFQGSNYQRTHGNHQSHQQFAQTSPDPYQSQPGFNDYGTPNGPAYSGGYGGYGPPPGPPPQGYLPGSGGFAPPAGPPPGQHGGYNSPPGPPPMQYGQYAPPPNLPSHMQGMTVHAQPQQQQGQWWQYSNCTGKRKALCIGINYEGSSSALRGCHNDARNVQRFLISQYKYNPDDIVMLLDSQSSQPRQIPTRQNMIDAMRWLVQGAQPNDSLFFHYSGHGGSTKDLDGDEDDGMDEVIYPLDFKQAGHIVDDEIHDLLVRPLPPGCRLTAIFDACHSATAMDLPYVYSTEGVIKEPNMLAGAGSGAMTAATSYLRGDVIGAATSLFGIGKTLVGGGGKAATEKTRREKTSPADVVSFSGCKDDQTSADTQEAGQATGAMSFAFIAALSKFSQLTYLQLLNAIRDELRGKYQQKPQLSSSHPMDVNALFIA